MASKTYVAGGIGVVAGLASIFCGDILPDVVLSGEFAATATTNAVLVPAGVASVSLRTFVHGAPTTATVVIEGSVDGVTWTVLPVVDSLISGNRYTQVRARAVIAGGTSPTVTFVAIAKA